MSSSPNHHHHTGPPAGGCFRHLDPPSGRECAWIEAALRVRHLPMERVADF